MTMQVFTDNAGAVNTSATGWNLSVAGIRGATGPQGAQGPRGTTGQEGITYLHDGIPQDGSLLSGQLLGINNYDLLSSVPVYYNPDEDAIVSVIAPFGVNTLNYVGQEPASVYVYGKQEHQLLRLEDNGATFGSRITMLARNGRVEMRSPVMGLLGITGVFVPSTTGSAGVTGQMSFDSNYFYVCVGTNNWKRAGLTGWW